MTADEHVEAIIGRLAELHRINAAIEIGVGDGDRLWIVEKPIARRALFAFSDTRPAATLLAGVTAARSAAAAMAATAAHTTAMMATAAATATTPHTAATAATGAGTADADFWCNYGLVKFDVVRIDLTVMPAIEHRKPT